MMSAFCFSLPAGVDYASPEYAVNPEDVTFLTDITYLDSEGTRTSDQHIFDEIFAHIDAAQRYILVDMFLFNSFLDEESLIYRDVTDELAEHLIRKRQQNPGVCIDFITDPINTVYGGSRNVQLEDMQEAGINVIITDLTRLRDSNPLYSIPWRILFQWMGNEEHFGVLHNPFAHDAPRISLRSYLALLNCKANHRKIFVADHEGDMVTIVTSANPHGCSSAHSNVGIKIRGPFWQEAYASEAAVAAFSGGALQSPGQPAAAPQQDGPIRVQLLSERRIKEAFLAAVNDTQKGDCVDLGVFYLADRDIVTALVNAARRGAAVRLILDPNKDAFGHEKNGIPNRQVAGELLHRSHDAIKLRWYDTHGEQFHTKTLLVRRQDGTSTVLLGSANFTRRNLDNYNLETDVRVCAATTEPIVAEMHTYFDDIWGNRGDRHCTVDYAAYAEDNFIKDGIYLFQEYTGISTF